MATTRTEVMAAIELAVVVLSAINPAAGRRDDFVDATGLDPALVGNVQGRRAARILSGVLAALRERHVESRTGIPAAQKTA